MTDEQIAELPEEVQQYIKQLKQQVSSAKRNHMVLLNRVEKIFAPLHHYINDKTVSLSKIDKLKVLKGLRYVNQFAMLLRWERR